MSNSMMKNKVLQVRERGRNLRRSVRNSRSPGKASWNIVTLYPCVWSFKMGDTIKPSLMSPIHPRWHYSL